MNYQRRVADWIHEAFGHEVAANKAERCHRFLEEALELVQSLDCTAEEAHKLVDYVFARPVGEPHQEMGGVMVTAAGLSEAVGLNMEACAECGLFDCWDKIDKIRAKRALKPEFGPLPT